MKTEQKKKEENHPKNNQTTEERKKKKQHVRKREREGLDTLAPFHELHEKRFLH